MKQLKSVGIVGVGAYVPEKIMTNFDLEKIVETSDEWITSRTGIKERHIAEENEATSDLGYEAAKKALKDANLKPEDIDLIIVATITPDYPFPATAAIIQDKLGAKNAAVFDLEAACSGLVYGIVTGANFISTGAYKNVLVIGAEALSKIMDWTDRNTCVLFGDGAGAVVLSEVEEGYGVLSFDLGADGSGGHTLDQPGGGSRNPATVETVNNRMHYLKMKGKEVFKFAVNVLPKTTLKTLEKAELTIDDVKLYIPHQANFRIIDSAAKKLNESIDKFYMNMDRFGNTSAASIGIALSEIYENKKLKKGDNILLVGFGAGLTYASCVIKWAK
ncbi:3-oxoacyl-[acyl-carrier-protein] synthase III [Hypnocyclicus thermotrophus]|uniref:Beta-ketoacyl-[acyl-carrier-protein] synthase III n=1 Tax=Hypnocyclicus thermotrophus TaxID=1627895 RepID=A0AA46DYJ0_9FUSO|nr:beta-ketoacyl-ACP synthase III [Hypnocyclicus thermotrophus]TDT70443.1 3-oxoacyl-[acyl-carrier-protein] synthase III [Hypnocyclicus thermotrophus]